MNELNKEVKSLKYAEYLAGVAVIVIGLALAVFADFFSSFFSILISVLILICGLTMVSSSLYENKHYSMPVFRLISGFLLVAIGIAALMNPELIMSFMSVMIGLIALLVGMYRLYTAISFSRAGYGSVWCYIEAVINVLFALFMLFYPIYGNSLLVMIFGIYMVYFGVTFIVAVKSSMLYFKKM